MGKAQSVFKFVVTESVVEVWWARVLHPEEPFTFRCMSRAPDTRGFWRLVQSRLVMQDDDTWAEPGDWVNDKWVSLR